MFIFYKFSQVKITFIFKWQHNFKKSFKKSSFFPNGRPLTPPPLPPKELFIFSGFPKTTKKSYNLASQDYMKVLELGYQNYKFIFTLSFSLKEKLLIINLNTH